MTGRVIIFCLCGIALAAEAFLLPQATMPKIRSAALDMASSCEDKNLVLIRHGLSYMNEYIGENGITFGGPNFTDIFPPDDHEKFYRDTPLSTTGQEQAKELGKTIEVLLKQEDSSDGDMKCLEDLDLVVVSPLTRTIQTAQLALFPHIDSIPVIALPLAAERLYLVSDIGRPKSELERKHGNIIDFQTAFPEDPQSTENWWYQQDKQPTPEWRPTGQGQAYFCPGEPYDAFQERMLDLCDWLDGRPESTIALVGHYGVFEWLLQGEGKDEKVKFSNCALKVVTFDTILANAERRRRSPSQSQH